MTDKPTSAETKLKEELDKSHQQKEEQHQEEEGDTPGLLPPQALLSTPPPPLPSTEDTSTLLSPWWSEEPQSEEQDKEVVEQTPHRQDQPTVEQEPTTDNNNNNNSNSILNISLLSFSRSSPQESTHQWKERCMLLAFTELEKQQQKEEDITKKSTGQDAQKELLDIFDQSKDCRMVCFLRASRELSKPSLNPFHGTFVSVAKTPKRCKEHLLDAGNMSKKSFSDYYTMELGHELSHSGEYVATAVQKTFSPLQHLTQRYIDSWKDGTQQAFFYKFWSSIQKGDAFYLVKDSTKRLIENALGHDKKPSDKK